MNDDDLVYEGFIERITESRDSTPGGAWTEVTFSEGSAIRRVEVSGDLADLDPCDHVEVTIRWLPDIDHAEAATFIYPTPGPGST
jgi:hypothetical protein